METIDIEDFASYVKSSFVTYFTNLAWATLVGAAPWLNVPIVRDVVKFIIERSVTFLATKGGLVAFMINTGVFTRDQAKDYIEVVTKIDQLPDDVPNAEWEKMENEANRAFENLVRFSA